MPGVTVLPYKNFLAGSQCHRSYEEGEGEVEEEGGDVSLRAILLGVALDKPSVVGDLGTLGGVWPERVVDSAVQWCVGEECHGQCDHALMMVTVINTMSILQAEHTHDYKKVHKVVLHHVPPGSIKQTVGQSHGHTPSLFT